MTDSLGDKVAAAARLIIPKPILHRLRGDFKSVRGRFIQDRGERFKLFVHKLKGGSYLSWYAARQDSSAKLRKVEDPALQKAYYDSGADDLETFKLLGVRPHHTMHEFGCGYLRTGRYVVEYLDVGNFSANDASGERMDAGKKYFKEHGFDIDSRRPKLIVNANNSMDWLGRKVDYIWCHAVFTHQPAEDIEEVIRNFRKIMHAGSVCLFTYSEKPGMTTSEEHMGVKDWWHKFEFFVPMAERHGYAIEDLSQFFKSRGCYRPENRLAKLTLRGK